MPDVTIDYTFLVILLVFGAGLALGWVAHAITTPRHEELPHVKLKTSVAPLCASAGSIATMAVRNDVGKDGQEM